METTPALYSVNTFARLTDMSRSGVYSWMRQGLLRFVIIGSERRIPASELERLLNEGSPAKDRYTPKAGPGRKAKPESKPV